MEVSSVEDLLLEFCDLFGKDFSINSRAGSEIDIWKSAQMPARLVQIPDNPPPVPRKSGEIWQKFQKKPPLLDLILITERIRVYYWFAIGGRGGVGPPKIPKISARRTRPKF